MREIEAFILIGGRSSRLGSDKAFVELGGKTLMQGAVDVVRKALDCRIKIVAGDSEQFAVKAIASDIPFIFDLYAGRGPLGGLHAALANAVAPWIFILACDYPLVTAEIVRILSTRISDEFAAVVPEQEDGRLQPLCAFYRVGRVLPVVEETLRKPRPTPPMHEVVTLLEPRIVSYREYAASAEGGDPFLNINTLADLRAAQDREDGTGRGTGDRSA